MKKCSLTGVVCTTGGDEEDTDTDQESSEDSNEDLEQQVKEDTLALVAKSKTVYINLIQSLHLIMRKTTGKYLTQLSLRD